MTESMPENTIEAKEPVPTTKTPVKIKPKPTPKKKVAATTTKKTEGGSKTFHGVEMKSGRFWNKKRIAIVESLRGLGAESVMTSRSYGEVAKKAGSKITERNVIRYCSDKEPLVAGGIVKKAKVEDQVAVKLYLTALGKKCKFDY